MLIPISIEGEYYNSDNFVRRINKSNKKNIYKSKKFKNSSGLFEKYSERNYFSPFMRVLLFYLYDIVTPQTFNGVQHWNNKFNDEIDDDTYLQEILVSKLNQFLTEGKREGEISKCESYKEYIHACIRNNYIPKLDIRWSEKYGWGVYAEEDIYSFMYIGLYIGQIQQLLWLKLIDIIRGFHNKYEFAFCYNEIFAINSEKYGNYTRFINHDTGDYKRISTFSIQIASDMKAGIPHRGFIANVPSSDGECIMFRRGEQLLWNYGKYYNLDI